MQKSPFSGVQCLVEGAHLLTLPKLRVFIIIPLLINLVLFIIATSILIQQFSGAIAWVLGWIPSWLDFLLDYVAWILWPIMVFSVLLVYGYSFGILTNIIAAPFNGILAEKIETHLTQVPPPPEPLSAMIPRTLGREMMKLWYFFSRGLLVLVGIFILSFIPGLNLLASVAGIVWGAWTMAIQYIDYPADNHQTKFKHLREYLGEQGLNSFSFGGTVMLATMIPVINIFAMPIAVAGATVFWVKSGGER
jgi:CysZ protein